MPIDPHRIWDVFRPPRPSSALLLDFISLMETDMACVNTLSSTSSDIRLPPAIRRPSNNSKLRHTGPRACRTPSPKPTSNLVCDPLSHYVVDRFPISVRLISGLEIVGLRSHLSLLFEIPIRPILGISGRESVDRNGGLRTGYEEVVFSLP